MHAFLDVWKEPTFYNDIFNYWVAWLSAVGCFVLSFYAARHVSDHPRCMTVLALFAGAWVLLAAAIGARIDALMNPAIAGKELTITDRASDVASFLFVFAGAILARESAPNSWANWGQRWVQLGGLWLLFFIVLPERIPLRVPMLDPKQTDLIVGELLTIAGFASLALGVYATASRRVAVVFALVLVAYESLSLLRTTGLIGSVSNPARPAMGPEILYPLIMIRFVVTAMLCYVVVTYCRRPQPAGTP